MFPNVCFLNYSKIKREVSGNFNTISGVFKVEGDFFPKLFEEQDFGITVFLGGRPGIGQYVNDFGDDMYISLGTEIGFKIKYKDFYACFSSTKIMGFQEPSGGDYKYNQSYLGVSIGVIVL